MWAYLIVYVIYTEKHFPGHTLLPLFCQLNNFVHFITNLILDQVLLITSVTFLHS